LGTALRLASYVPINAPIAPLMRSAATALDAASLAAENIPSATINPQDSPIAPFVPQQLLDVVESQMGNPPKKKRKVSKAQKNFGKALKEAKRKHPRLAKSKSNSARSQLFKAAWKLARKMK
jgi:MoxR-like ATPase